MIDAVTDILVIRNLPFVHQPTRRAASSAPEQFLTDAIESTSRARRRRSPSCVN
jgi:hypothetical protein